MLLGDGCSTVCKQKVSDRCLMFSQVKSTARECQSGPYGKDTPTPKQSRLEWTSPSSSSSCPHTDTVSMLLFHSDQFKVKTIKLFSIYIFFLSVLLPSNYYKQWKQSSTELKLERMENKGVEMTSLTLAKLLVTPLNSGCAVNLSPLSLSVFALVSH